MYKVLFSLVMLIFFSGCFGVSPQVINPSEKVFEEEDILIMMALRAEQVKSYEAASSAFNELYEHSSKKEYLYRSLQNDLHQKKFERVIKRVDEELDESFDDFYLVRIKILALINMSKLEEAKEIALILVDKSQNINDYILVSDIYVKLSKYDTALKYLEGAYAKDYNEKILDKIAIILYVNLERKKDAIAHLETHAKVHGCSKIICTRLISIYSNENDIDALLRVYLKLYEIDKSEQVAQKIVQIYGYTKDYINLIAFLEENQNDDRLLLQMYTQVKNYAKAAPLAQKLYDKTAEISYLGQSAIFEYEASKDKEDKNMHKSVIEKLKQVVQIEPKALYFNYLGYLLIDHSIDVKAGLGYIEKALQEQPDSVFYLDSKAWGFYKLGECKKAFKIMKRIVKMDGGDEKEVQDHYKTIKRCLKTKKGKN
ncbi:tetratricopeptide repeat protein [Sulfurimonas sp.]|uniref:tetratricopeptide repeat protein n=1 Tax=Sulfurimonas sp. TaxID=2022749 RepID=UPI00356A96EE